METDCQCLSTDEFKELIDQPATKRSRIDEETANENMAALWESNYVPVETKLPSNSYLLVNFF